MSTVDPVLTSFREQIDALDAQLVEAVNQRLETVLALRRHKEQNGIDFYDPEREARLVERLKELNEGPLSPQGVQELAAFVLDLIKREASA
jgi:chorismate mutase / prephenate dehydratase